MGFTIRRNPPAIALNRTLPSVISSQNQRQAIIEAHLQSFKIAGADKQINLRVMQRLRAADAKTSGGRHYDLHDSARSGMRNRSCVMPGFDTGNSMQKQRINIVSTSSAVNQQRKNDSRPCSARRSAYSHRSCLPVSPIYTLLAELGWRSQIAYA